MRNKFYSLILFLFAVVHLFSTAQSFKKETDQTNIFSKNWFKTSSINSGDTIVFDLSQAVCSGTYMIMPVSIISDDVIYAVDFSMKYNNNKITYDSTLTYKSYLTTASNFNGFDSILRYTSFSFIQPIEHNTYLSAIRFQFHSGPVNASDFNTISAFLNGDVCSYKFINPVLPTASITANGPIVFPLGDSVKLTVAEVAGCTYLWSTGATTRTIKVVNSGTYTVTVSNPGGCQATAFANVFVLAPLPVQLLNFNLEEAENGIAIIWVATNETDNNYYTLERSSNMTNWNEIAKIYSTGGSNTNNYFFLDEQPSFGINYYRLKQTDDNGKSIFLKMASQLFNGKNSNKLSCLIYPMPANQLLNIYTNRDGRLEILDLNGKLVMPASIVSSNTEAQINVNRLSIGAYILKVYTNNTIETQKLIIER